MSNPEAAQFSDADLLALLQSPIEPEAAVGMQVGDLLQGTVEEVDDSSVYVKLGEGVFGRCAVDEARPPRAALGYKPGDVVTVQLDSAIDDTRWNISIGKPAALAILSAWKQRAQEGATVTGTVQMVTRGGFAIEAEGLRCFLPARESGIRMEESFAAVGRKLNFEVTGWDDERAEAKLSRKRFLDEERKALREGVLSTLTEGQAVHGRVKSLMPFGAFVDIGGIDALLHVSDIALERVENPADVLSVGEEIDAVILEIDREKGRIAITRRDLLQAEQRLQYGTFKPGDVVRGKVTRFADFGAFVELAEGVEGLCHVSELSWSGRIGHPSEVLHEGDETEFKVLDVDRVERRIALSVRQLRANPIESFREGVGEGALITGTITRIEQYGLFLKVAEDLEGLCHISDLSWTKRPDKPTDVAPFKVGDSLEVRVLSVDVKGRRLKLGLKQVTADPWQDAGDKTHVGTILKATVTRFDRDAAYLQVAPNLEGRIHISEVALDRVDSIRSALRIGQDVEVMVIKSDAVRRRLDLSVKAVAAKHEAETPRGYADADTSVSALAAALQKARG